MKRIFPIRDLRAAVVVVCLAWAVTGFGQRMGHAGRGQGFRQSELAQAPVERRVPPGSQGQESHLAPIVRRSPPGQAPGARGEHLAEWMSQHRNLTPEQQQQALDREPGFRELPPQTQQRMHNRLAQLNAMSPQQRQRLLNRNEWMEHLSLPERAEVRGSMQQLGALPLDQRLQVARSFRELRQFPPDQRGAMLNSPQYQYMNPAQRAALNRLLSVEPLIPPTEQR